LVEGIRPVLPLIRNTPYGKRIQNKLQREQMDHYNNGYHNQQAMVNMAITNQGLSTPHTTARHLPQTLHGTNPLTDVYGSQNGLYPIQQTPATAFGQAPLSSQLHGLQPQSIDGYVLQGNSSHNLSSSHPHNNGFSGASFPTVNPFGGAAGLVNSLNDPYQRSAFGYGM